MPIVGFWTLIVTGPDFGGPVSAAMTTGRPPVVAPSHAPLEEEDDDDLGFPPIIRREAKVKKGSAGVPAGGGFEGAKGCAGPQPRTMMMMICFRRYRGGGGRPAICAPAIGEPGALLERVFWGRGLRLCVR